VNRSKEPNVVLVGFMGTGKSAVGRALARRMGRRLFDTDAWIVGEAAMPIPALFTEFGEEAFRQLETRAAARVERPQALVVSTGGGILGQDENVDLLRRGGVLINLTARPEIILKRTAPWDSRPMLKTAANPEEAVLGLLAERAERYALADWTIDSSDLAVSQVADQICERLPSLFREWRTRSVSGPD
jgi:shikimate kinase